jgi:hypothetical protein
MQVSFSKSLDDGRETTAIGRIKTATRWRAADEPASEDERQAAIEALKREAAEYDADAIVDVRFDVDDVKGVDIDSVALQRVTVFGLGGPFRSRGLTARTTKDRIYSAASRIAGRAASRRRNSASRSRI